VRKSNNKVKRMADNMSRGTTSCPAFSAVQVRLFLEFDGSTKDHADTNQL